MCSCQQDRKIWSLFYMTPVPSSNWAYGPGGFGGIINSLCMGVVVPKPQGWCWDSGCKERTKNTEQLKQMVLSSNPGFSILLVKWFNQVCFLTYLCRLSHFSPVWLFVMLWTVTNQSPLSMGFSRQEYWSGLPFPSPGDLPSPGIKPTSLISPALAGRFFTTSTKKDPNDPDNHDGVITDLEPDVLECKVKWPLWSITMNKASGGDGIPAELFQILKEDTVKVLQSICQQIWKTQQWPQN